MNDTPDNGMADELAALRRRVEELEARAGRSMHDPEELCCAMFDALGDPAVGTDCDLKVIGINSALRNWLERLGLETDVVGRDLLDAFGFLPDSVREDHLRAAQSAESHLAEITLDLAGERTVCEVRRSPVVVGGQIVRVLTVIRDITNRKQAENDLRESEERLRAIFSSLYETGIVVYDREGTFVEVWGTDALGERFGITAEQLRGRNVRDVYSPEQAEWRIGRIREVLETGNSLFDEYTIELPAGTFWLETTLSPMRDAEGNVSAVVGFVRDVTERKQATEALRDSEEQFRQIADNVRYGMWVQDARAMKMLYVSRACAQIFGRTVDDLMNDPAVWYEAIHPEDKKEPQPPGWEAFESEYRVVHGDAGIRWVNDLTVPVRDEDGQLVRIVGIIEDITERKQAEKAVLLAKDQWERTFNTVPDMIAVIDSQYRIIRTNRAMADRLGMSPDQCVGKICYACIHGTDEPVESCPHARLVADGQGHAAEVYEPHLAAWLHITVSPLCDDQGHIIGSVHVARDITERKQAAEALAESEQRYRSIFKASGAGIALIDAEDGHIEDCNAEFEKLSGRTLEQLRKMKVWEIRPPEKIDPARAKFLEILAGGIGGSRDLEFQRPDGSIVSVDFASRRVMLGGKRYLESVVLDITERKRAENALAESEEKYRQLFTTESDAVAIFDARTRRFLDVNDAALELYGYTRAEFLALVFSDITADPQQCEANIRQVVAGTQDHFPVGYHKKKDGTVFPIEISASTFMLGGRRVLCGVVRDITERKQAERDLRDAHGKLVNAREAERRRLASELHDSVSQDIVAVQLAIQKAADAGRGKLDAEQNHLLIAAAAQCVELVKEVRSICYALYPSTLHTLGLVAALRQLGRYCKEHVEFSLVCPDDIDVPRFDDEREIALYRIAQEAVNNALRHAGAGKIQLQLSRSADEITLEIVDDGCGFEPARRAHAGFGLTTMSDRAKAAGGELTIVSEPGRTCVKVSVPMSGSTG